MIRRPQAKHPEQLYQMRIVNTHDLAIRLSDLLRLLENISVQCHLNHH